MVDNSIFFEKVYYKVLDFDTNEIIIVKECNKKICQILNIPINTINITLKNKKGYYTNFKTKKKYKFVPLN